MKLRAPAYPLITVDPYFSVWSFSDKLNASTTCHWTGHPNTLLGTVTVDGEELLFMGTADLPPMEQTDVDFDAFSTSYTFKSEKIVLSVRFMTPLLPDDLRTMTRPVSYMAADYESCDGCAHDVRITVLASEELVMNTRGDDTVVCTEADAGGIPCIKMGKEHQNVLCRSGDDLRIEWGYFCLGVPGGEVSHLHCEKEGMTFVRGSAPLSAGQTQLILFAYDDVTSIEYFGEHLRSVWNADGTSIEEAIADACEEYELLETVCRATAEGLYLDAVKCGGVHYAEILSLAFRQVIAAHKCVLDPDGSVLFISKECYSNGCAATVDVSYPSIPMFLLYNPELVRGMLRPIFKYAESPAWPYDFAPHDAGQYPLVNGQVYGENRIECQMPVEECGNMLIITAAEAIASGDPSFAAAHWDTLSRWVKYLVTYGEDPENQLCTDDFAGHLAHNCNLSIKAIMGIASFGLLNRMLEHENEAESYLACARRMAESFAVRAANSDGSYRLAFDRPGTYSMKYNAVWDKLFGTRIFSEEMLQSEVASNFAHMKPYGMPLDNRADYTKSDWLVWTATLCRRQEDFERYIAPLWNAFHFTKNRVPMTDWYDTITAEQYYFQNRTVQGGLFIKLLEESGILFQG